MVRFGHRVLTGDGPLLADSVEKLPSITPPPQL
jgi:hypothetical protein